MDHWILADSSGYSAPRQIRELLATTLNHVPAENVTVQIHDARGMGPAASLLPLLDLGVGNIDTSLAGSGGHPAMPGAQGGGVCTEGAVQLLELSGVRTGIDLSRLIDAANWLATERTPRARGSSGTPTRAGRGRSFPFFQW